MLADGPLTATVQIVANLPVFASLGFLAPIRFAVPASAWRMPALGAGLSILVETLQYVLRLDRVSSRPFPLREQPWERATVVVGGPPGNDDNLTTAEPGGDNNGGWR
ncbi:VanZ family protein [Actinoplanes sp. NBRC 101535]|uniref:VanZ family protein n=1 Tax=Actinoplanes sp. NBRC 101535 TaxID=3032196 RepID=UPI0024A3634C|nr:VanZ family protein [Actinoplanes sp. NBRC 101535]GLY03163.1 hypothetical protein Acsp01_35420 [Actinoplanes sp. NBRC 101535]